MGVYELRSETRGTFGRPAYYSVAVLNVARKSRICMDLLL